MKVPYYKGKKRTRRFSREKSGSLIIHENVSENEEKKLPKKIYAKDFVQNLSNGR